MQNSRYALIGVVVAALILLIGFFFYHKVNAPTIPSSSEATTTTTLSSGLGVSGTGNYTVTQVPVNTNTTPAPNFRATLIFTPGTPSDVEAALNAQIAQAQATIATSSTDFNAWITLGDIRKEAGDYTGAAEDWQYMSALYPGNIISFNNLGDLYTNFLPNYPKAVAEYEQEIKNNSTQPDAYAALFSLYTNQYPQGASDPTAILKQGIASSPKSLELYVLLARYYAGKGDKKDASAQYAVAIGIAQQQGDTAAILQLEQEQNAL